MSEKLKVLLVEDSDEDAELVLRFVRKFAKELHYERVWTENGMRDAYNKGGWDLVLSDYTLPQFSGLDAIRVLKELKSDVPLVIVSGTIGEETAIEALKLGASDYVLKSNLGRLTTSIGHALKARKAQVENRNLMKQLEQAQKMEAVGRLAGGIAHDVNNVLSAVVIYAENALEAVESSDVETVKQCLNEILSAQQSAAAIVKQLLSFSRKTVAPTRIVNFSSVLEGSRPLIKTLFGGYCQFKMELPKTAVQVEADPTQIEQVVMNLAVNARDAMANGGTFTLSLDVMQLDAPRTDARIPIIPGRYACLSAKDSGCGIPPEILDRIFEPFFTTKEVGKGTGLGLSVIYGIIERAKGTLLVESSIGNGTEFRVLWPLVSTGEPHL